MHGLPDYLFGDRFVCARVVYSAREQVGLGPHPAVVIPKRAEQLLTERNLAVDAALALYYTKHHALAVYVRHFETAQFRTAQARGIEGHQDGAVIEVPRRADQLSDLIRTEDHRQPQALLWIR